MPAAGRRNSNLGYRKLSVEDRILLFLIRTCDEYRLKASGYCSGSATFRPPTITTKQWLRFTKRWCPGWCTHGQGMRSTAWHRQSSGRSCQVPASFLMAQDSV